MRLQSTETGLGIAVSRLICAENVIINGGTILIAFDVANIFVSVARRSHFSCLVGAAIDAVIHQERILFQRLTAVGDELACDGNGVLHGLFAKEHIAMVDKQQGVPLAPVTPMIS